MTVIQVHLVPVLPGAADDPVLLARLGAGEREAISSLGFAADRDRAVTARAAARFELGRRLGLQPRRVPLLSLQLTGGRPVVRGTDIEISWSHSGGLVALSLASGRPVGVDIERLPARTPFRALARIGLASIQEFVALEAAGKVTGQGLAVPWPAGVSIRPFQAPAGYLGAVAAPGDDWSVDLHPPEPREPPASASATAIGLWDPTGAGSRKRAYAR
jgi:hypothetical protein